MIKVVLVIGMLGLALFNRLRVKDCQQRPDLLRASIVLEWLLGIGAVAAVSLLGTLPPMMPPEHISPVGAPVARGLAPV